MIRDLLSSLFKGSTRVENKDISDLKDETIKLLQEESRIRKDISDHACREIDRVWENHARLVKIVGWSSAIVLVVLTFLGVHGYKQLKTDFDLQITSLSNRVTQTLSVAEVEMTNRIAAGFAESNIQQTMQSVATNVAADQAARLLSHAIAPALVNLQSHLTMQVASFAAISNRMAGLERIADEMEKRVAPAELTIRTNLSHTEGSNFVVRVDFMPVDDKPLGVAHFLVQLHTNSVSIISSCSVRANGLNPLFDSVLRPWRKDAATQVISSTPGEDVWVDAVISPPDQVRIVCDHMTNTEFEITPLKR